MPAIETALGTASKVGPYFSVISFVPATVAVTATTFLLAAHPWTGEPHWGGAAQALATPSLGQLAALLASSMLLALVLHPLQYPLVQLLEGYWGVRPVPLRIAQARIAHHRQVVAHLEGLEQDAADDEEAALAQDDASARAGQAWKRYEAERLLARYPHRDHVMPTMLGNALRRYENQAGLPYGLSVVAAAPHLALVAAPADIAYVRDQRTQLDLATRLCVTAALMTVVMVVLLASCGWWLLLSVIPYGLAHLFYAGACSVAAEYGTSLQAMLDLNRPALYARLRMPLPTTLGQERVQNETLSRVLGQRTREDLSLAAQPSAPNPTRPAGT